MGWRRGGRPSLRNRSPIASVVIGQGEGHQQREPEESGDHDNADESAAVPHAHEEQNHERHLRERDGQSCHGVKWSEIDEGNACGQNRKPDQA